MYSVYGKSEVCKGLHLVLEYIKEEEDEDGDGGNAFMFSTTPIPRKLRFIVMWSRVVITLNII